MTMRLSLKGVSTQFVIGSFQHKIPTQCPVTELSPTVAVAPAEMPQHSFSLPSRRLLDLGGAGDCFFLALNAALSVLGEYRTGVNEVPSAEDIYRLLDLPNKTYIEDTHIMQFLGLYPFSLVVVREYGNDLVFRQFGVEDDIVFLYNDYPRHYLLIDQCYVGAEFKTYQEMITNSTVPAVKPNTKSLSEDVGFATSYPKLFVVESEMHDDPVANYCEELDLAYLYKYVDSRYTIRKEGLALTGKDSEIYYKLRHNLFKTMFLDILGLASTEEKPFTLYGVDSNRTPDLILELPGTMVIVEFTVVKRFVTSIATKKSQNKYAEEVALLESGGRNVIQFYPTLSLDENVSAIALELYELSDLLSKPLFVDPEKVFSDLQTELNSLEYNISELLPELLLNQQEFSKVEFGVPSNKLECPSPFPIIIQKVGIKRQRDQTTYLLIRKNARSLERQLKQLRYSAKFVLIVNRRHNRVYADADQSGIQKNKLLSMILNNSPELVKYVQYVGTQAELEEPFKIMGEPKIQISEARKELVIKTVEVDSFESYYSSKLHKGAMAREMKTLVDAELSKQVPLVESTYLKKMKINREEPRTIVFEKNWFIFPCATNLVKGSYEPLCLETKKTLTDRLLRQCSPVPQEKVVERNTDLVGLDRHLKSVNESYQALLKLLNHDRKIARKLKNIYKKEDLTAAATKYHLDLDTLAPALSHYQTKKSDMIKAVGEPTRKSYRNRINLPGSYLKTNWPAEMEHFNGPTGKIKICPDMSLEELQTKVDSLTETLWQEQPDSTTDDTMSNTEPLGLRFAEILKEMKTLADDVSNSLRKTQIMHDLEFISRLAYTVMYYSNIKSNKEDFFFDNLGYENAIVFVKGGKKILSNKKSRLFKLIFPIKKGFSWLYKSPNTTLVEKGGVTYCVLPWQTWHFNMLKKATELYYSFSNFYICSFLESGLELETYKKFFTTKVLNMYSQRRKVEIWFGYFRYLYLNSMSTHTSVLDLIEDMVDHEYDPYFSYFQKKFARRYKDIYKNASESKIYDMCTGVLVENFDLCAEKFDECVFMTVAPFDRVNEHLRNLRSVLTMHSEVMSKFSADPMELLKETAVDIYDDDYFKKLSSDDLMFDPKLTYSVGKFAADYLASNVSLTALSSEFNKIIQQTYTDISTSKGMRSSHGQFWGNKGHDVVFGKESMLNMVHEFISQLPATHSEYRKKLVDSHVSFSDRIKQLSRLTLEFDLKDKAQWKGSREIYVMTETTKILQGPLEKFFKYLCTWVPNELIHKKSHVRPKFIHGQVFEFENTDDVTTFATLDCRRWAPKSNLWKYYYFVKGMSHKLPQEFVEYFEQVWSLMFSKKVRVQKIYVDLLKKNPKTLPLTETLREREDGDFEFVMPYSFMMGIFNYLSSLLHAFSQLYFDAKISRKFGVTFNLLAHSDDSGGAIFSSSEQNNYDMFRKYEMYQKGLNHLMSKKKCSLSRNFFEMISIMYANRRLIPMTHKFIANTSFEPKGKGWVDDISTVVSKVVEIFSNGGTMLQCYLTMLSMTEMIRKFYHVPRLTLLSHIPLAYGGVFNLHPIHLILLGADAQEILLDTVETSGERSFRISVAESIFGEYFPGKGCNVNYHIPYYKNHTLTDSFEPEEMDKLKLIAGVIPRTTLGQAAGHYSRLRDPAYVYSLSGVDMCQIFVMTLFTKTMVLGLKDQKKCDLRRLTTKYSVLKALGLFSSKVTKSLSSFHHYAKASESIRLPLDSMNVASKKTCKPLIYNTFQTLGLGLSFSNINELIAYWKDESLRFMFPDKIRMETLTSWVKNNLSYSNDYSLEDYLMKISGKDVEKTRSSYCFIPSGINVDTVERFWTYINFYCTRRYWVSELKPQYFTVDQFKLWGSDYETLKHLYIILKVALRCEMTEENKSKLLLSADCKSCGYKEAARNTVEEIWSMRETPNFSFISTKLPFAVYTQAQRRSVNVWYGMAEFILYTQFGNVEVTRRLGEIYHIYYISDPEVLDQVHFLLKNFLATRGMQELDVAYSINDTAGFKLGFGDLNQPKIMYPGERGIMASNTLINIQETRLQRIYKEPEKFTLDGLTVDFEIYQNYDVNQTFYEEHGLDKIKNLIFGEEKHIGLDILRETAILSKTYEVLQQDPSLTASGNMADKYKPGMLLGSERSLTRALAISSSKGITSYRSTVSPDPLDTAVFEGMSHRDIPVLDLVDSFSFARVTYKERKVMERIVNEGTLKYEDTAVLDRLVAKLGIKPTLNALTTTRVIFSDMIYDDIKNLSKEVVEDYMLAMFKAAVNCLEDRFEGDPNYYLLGNKSQAFQLLALAIRSKASSETLAELFTKLFMRAQKTNPGRFWEERKVSIYAGLIVPRKESFKTQYLFNKAVLNKIGKDKVAKISTVRQIILALKQIDRNFAGIMKKLKRRRSAGTEYMESRMRFSDYEEMNYTLLKDLDTFDDEMDAVAGGDDPDEFEEREWGDDFDDYKYYLMSDLDVRCACEDTIKENFNTVELYSMTATPNFPWLGPCDVELTNVQGVPMYLCSYPGKLTKMATISDMKEKVVVRKESKPIPKEEEVVKGAWSGKTKVDSDIFGLTNEEDVYNYQVSVLKNLGILDPERFQGNFFKLKDVSNEDYFWNHFLSGLNLKASMKNLSIHTRRNRRTNILPGFTGNLKDDDLRAELNAFFKGHAEEILSGNQCLTEASYKTVLRNLRRLYRSNYNKDVRAYIIILLSTMKDCVLSNSSDSWYLDTLMEAIDSLEEDIPLGSEDDIPPTIPRGFSRNYEIRSPYEGL